MTEANVPEGRSGDNYSYRRSASTAVICCCQLDYRRRNGTHIQITITFATDQRTYRI